MFMRSRTYIAIPPGETIREQLEYHEMSRGKFAQKMDMSAEEVDNLLAGNCALSPETAAQLESVLGVPAWFWSGLEATYREDIEKVKRENAMKHSHFDGTASKRGDALAPAHSLW